MRLAQSVNAPGWKIESFLPAEDGVRITHFAILVVFYSYLVNCTATLFS